MKERLLYIGIIITLSILLALSWGRKPEVIHGDTVISVDSVFVFNYDTVYVPQPYKVTQTVVEKVIEKHTDTILIYDSFYESVEYRDTIRDKNSASYVYLHDVVTQNRLKRRYVDFYSSEMKSIKYVDRIEYKEKGHVYAGFDATTNLNLFFDITYKTPNKGLYSVGYDPINEHFKIGVKFKLF
jgi:hypothetical protein